MNQYTDELARLRVANPAPLEPDRGRTPAATATLARILQEPISEPVQVPSDGVRREDRAPSIKGVWRKLDDGAVADRRQPRRGFFWRPTQRRVWSRLVIVAAGAVAVVAALLVFGTAGSGPSRAFAGWSPTPTAAAPGETATALERCRSHLATFSVPHSSFPSASWKPRVIDTRGPFTALILRSGAASAACLNGPSVAAANATLSRGRSGWSMLFTNDHKALVMDSFLGSGPIQNAWQVHTRTSGGQPYTIVQGQDGARAARLTLLLSNGRDVQATVGDGSFIAWWPGRSSASSARLSSASCVTTQKLVFFNASKPQPVGASSPYPARRYCGPSSP